MEDVGDGTMDCRSECDVGKEFDLGHTLVRVPNRVLLQHTLHGDTEKNVRIN